MTTNEELHVEYGPEKPQPEIKFPDWMTKGTPKPPEKPPVPENAIRIETVGPPEVHGFSMVGLTLASNLASEWHQGAKDEREKVNALMAEVRDGFFLFDGGGSKLRTLETRRVETETQISAAEKAVQSASDHWLAVVQDGGDPAGAEKKVAIAKEELAALQARLPIIHDSIEKLKYQADKDLQSLVTARAGSLRAEYEEKLTDAQMVMADQDVYEAAHSVFVIRSALQRISEFAGGRRDFWLLTDPTLSPHPRPRKLLA